MNGHEEYNSRRGLDLSHDFGILVVRLLGKVGAFSNYEEIKVLSENV